MIRLRALGEGELRRIDEIDRRERVTVGYRVSEGVLVSGAVDWDVPVWSADRVERYVSAFTPQLRAGGFCLAAEDVTGGRLAGVATLGADSPATRPDLLPLLFFHVSRPYRRQGVAGRLLERIEAEATRRGARGLYISATPSESAVGFYLAHGATLITPDPALLEAEPEDIHLQLVFSERG